MIHLPYLKARPREKSSLVVEDNYNKGDYNDYGDLFSPSDENEYLQQLADKLYIAQNLIYYHDYNLYLRLRV